jgi:hypothetical protein
MKASRLPLLWLLLAAVVPPVLTACEEGAFEEAGEEIDDAADDVGDAIDDRN